ncbi:MAG: hypothetical protein A3E81_01775 [Gammaproteobacteria bacterium RIFCSPHIGHO2_12_FULL_36_30]|nr:MAG: hypothetical protein A3E81_01775 [Gammaproteobacteria bacterium RIFCSPHIGHO2_12_FULL_36_30]
MERSTQRHLNVTSKQSENVEIDLKQILNLIKHSYKIIVILTVIFLVFGIYYAQTRPPVYQSIAMVAVDGGLAVSGSNGGTSAVLSGLVSQQASSADVETVLLQTPYLLGEVVRQLKLDISVSPHFQDLFARVVARLQRINTGNIIVSLLNVPNDLLAKPLIVKIKSDNQYSLTTEDGKKILDGVVGQLESTTYSSAPLQIRVNSINARPGEQFDVVKQPVSDVANGMASNLHIKSEGDNTGILQLRYTTDSPEQAQKLLNHILVVAVAKNMKVKSQEAAKTLQFISHQLPISEHHLQTAESRLDKYSVKTGVFNSKSYGQILAVRISSLQKILEKLKFKKMILLQKYTPVHPLVIAITQKENEVKSQITKIKAQLNQFPIRGEKEDDMQRDARIQAGIYTALVKDAQSMEMMKASTVSSVRILSMASYPVSRIPVQKRAIIFTSTLIGLMISLVVVFVRHALSPIVEDPSDVEHKLGIPVSAIIPYSQKQMDYNKKIKHDKLYAHNNPFLLARDNANDISIESIRSLRTTIQMISMEAKNNVIAITGCSPSIGKSFLSSNLSTLLSELEKRVIVVDADMRLGKLSQCFGKIKAPGLSNYLKNDAPLDKIIQNVIPERLDFIATGIYPNNPSELLSQKMVGELIQLLSNRYDFVLIDTPPILAVTDPALILRYSSINFMVVGIGKDQMKEVQHAKNMLEKAGVILSGIVFNTLKQQKSGFGYNYDYTNYHYHYGKK